MPIPEGQFVTLANGYKIHLYDQGEGHPVVFLHGSGSGASGHSNFKGNYPFLVENGYRVIVPDLIGYGYSDKPDDVEYPLDFFVECVKQALDQVGVSKCSLIGNSLGGAIALKFALDYPDQVVSLNLMAPGGIENQPDYFTMPGMQILKQIFTQGNVDKESLRQFITEGLVYNQSVVDDELVDERWDIYQKQNDQCLKTMRVPNLAERLPEIQAPSIVFWGMNEQMMPETGIQTLAKGLKNTRVVLISECGHWAMAEHKDLFNRYTLDFLNEQTKK